MNFKNYLLLGAIIIYTVLITTVALVVSFFDRTGRGVHGLARIWTRLILFTSQVKVEIIGLERIELNRPYVLVANHQSHFDVAAMIAHLPLQLRFVAKRELLRVPFFGWAMYRGGHIIIERSIHQRAISSINAATDRIRSLGSTVIFFAEGSRSPNGSIQPFKKGGFVLAIQGGFPVLPVSISGSRKVMARDAWQINPGVIRIVICPPIETVGLTLKERDSLLKQTREVIVKNFDPDL